MDIETFISEVKASQAAETSNFQSFIHGLCAVLDVPTPDLATKDRAQDAYTFERDVTDSATGRTGFIDLYKRGSFIMEAKQGSNPRTIAKDPRQLELQTGIVAPSTHKTGTAVRGTPSWTKAMRAAYAQAKRYGGMLHRKEGWPPFMIVVDVGYVIEIYSDFSGTGQNYTQFRDGRRFRITMDDLRDPETRETLRLIWTNPQALDPSKEAARVTREIANQLAALGKSYEEAGHEPQTVARFLMRCLFTMFAEDVDLIPANSFTELLISMRGNAERADRMLEELWATMNTGGYSTSLREDVKRFNGGLFKECKALPINPVQLSLLIGAAEADWKEVEPAIFGTLLERALSKRERHKLGAHYTPRAYVERLVTPTIIQPLRADWDAVQAAAFALQAKGDNDGAVDTVQAFHHTLCETRVLDPACGSGNFLYVAMEQMKRLEGEVIDLLAELGDTGRFRFEGETVDPHQFLGLELNPWAVEVAELVLWIGYLQWHFKTFGDAAPKEPVLQDFQNIQHRDALLDLEGQRLRLNEDGTTATRWDGETHMTSATGQRVPDPNARREIYDFDSAKQTDWPAADFIIGNPPFIGASRLRDALGDGYTETLWAAHPKMPESADFVMYWWDKAAKRLSAGDIRRFGFITTNSLRQTFNRRVLEPYLGHKKKPISLLFAIPDHPWVDSKDGAAVRIAMTVAGEGQREGRLLTITSEAKTDKEGDGREVLFEKNEGVIFANLHAGVNIGAAMPLRANSALSSRGVMLFGSGFIITEPEAKEFGFGSERPASKYVKRYMNGRELLQTSNNRFIIDLFGLTETDAENLVPELYNHVYENVKPARDSNRDKSIRENWWIFGRPRSEIRPALHGLSRYIATVETSKHCLFCFVDNDVLPDNKLIVIALEAAWCYSVLTSRTHLVWARANAGKIGVYDGEAVYPKTECFDPFPFPLPTQVQIETLRQLGEQLDAHRKARLAEHPKLTLTQMYNVLEEVRRIEGERTGEVLEGKAKTIYEQGGIARLRDLHNQIDTAVAEAYDWPADLADKEILERLVALNRERALEESVGNVRWLRPDYQNPTGADVKTSTKSFDLQDKADTGKLVWPKALPEQMAMVRDVLVDLQTASVEEVRAQIKRGRTDTIRERLEALAAVGQAQRIEGEELRFAA